MWCWKKKENYGSGIENLQTIIQENFTEKKNMI